MKVAQLKAFLSTIHDDADVVFDVFGIENLPVRSISAEMPEGRLVALATTTLEDEADECAMLAAKLVKRLRNKLACNSVYW